MALIVGGMTLIGLVAASSVLFSQNFPSVPTEPPGSLTASCTNLQSIESWVPTGGGYVLFNCTSSAGAFLVSYAPATATPTFSLPANASDLYALPAYPDSNGTATSCAGFVGAIELSSGVAATFGTSGNWDYCVDAVGALQGFSVAWSS